MTSKKQIIIFGSIYFFSRLFSYLFLPGHILNAAATTVILCLTMYWLIRKDKRGWLLIAGEIILGGTGNLLVIGGLSLRTLLLISSMLIFSLQIIKQRQIWPTIKSDGVISLLLIIMLATAGWSAIRGYYLGNNLAIILADTVPYLFLLYYFPLKKLWQDSQFRQFIQNLLFATVISHLIFILFTFIAYSSGLYWIHDNYYQWFRDIAGGKITDLSNNFFRVVLNEQLLLTPLILYYTSRLINRLPQTANNTSSSNVMTDQILAGLLIITLSINLSRVYILALLIGLLILFTRQNWQRWLIYSLASILILIISFTSIHLIASHGKSLGWELFGLRMQAIAKPNQDSSALSRMLLLPEIWQKIKQRPIWGNGLGDTVTVYSPLVKDKITTPHFDWGYLEILDEMGLIGSLAWLSFLVFIVYGLRQKTLDIKNKRHWMAMFVSLLIINLTSPALFHVMGILLLIIILAV